MEKLYGNYLGLCINNADPEYRGRVQIFIPHIMPALFEGWNEAGVDRQIEIIGDNLSQSLTFKEIEQLKKMLPWAEAASPVFGNSASGHYNPQTGNFNQTYGTEAEAAGLTGAGSGAGGVADFIFNKEARRDANGNLTVYGLLPSDGGGSYEVAGINERYHPTQAAALRSLVEQGRYAEAEQQAKDYIISYTNSAVSLAANSGSELALRDAAFNRGLGGANWIAKYAAGISPSTGMNSSARQQIIAAQQNDPAGFLQRLREGAEAYETQVVGIRPEFISGLRNRWDDRLQSSLSVLNSTGINLNDPYSGLYPGSSNPAQILPQLKSTNNVFLGLEPDQEALLSTAANTVASTDTLPSVLPGSGVSTGSGGPGRSFSFNDAIENSQYTLGSDGILRTDKGVTACLNGTINIAGHITGNSDWYGATGINFANQVGEINDKLTSPDANNRVLYGNLGVVQGTNYVAQQGDIAVHIQGAGQYGHAMIFVDGNWHSYKAGDNSFENYLNISGQQTTVFRLTEDGIAAVRETGNLLTEYLGEPYSGPIGPITQIADVNGFEGQAGMVRHPTSSQPTVTDTTGMPQGLFSVPNPGAMLWVFFREGDPMYPVYFAASYGGREWQNAWKAASPSAHYPQEGDTTPRNQAIFRPNQSGGISFVDTITEQEDARSIRVFHANGGHLEFHLNGSVLYSPNEHIQQVAGNAYTSCLNREDWSQGDSNRVVIGDSIEIVGNASEEALAIIEEHAQIVKGINKNMLKGS